MKTLSAVLTFLVITLPGFLDDLFERPDCVTEDTRARHAREASQ